MTTFRIFAAWFAYKSLQMPASNILRFHSQGLTSLPFDEINIIWNSLLLSRSESSHHLQHRYQRRHHLRHVCVRLFRQWQSSASASGRVARALFLTLCSSSSFSSHFVGVWAFPHTLIECELFLTPWSSSSFRLVFAFDWSSMMVVGVSTVKVFLLVVMLVMLVKPWYKGSSLICHNAFDVLEHWHHTTCRVYFPS